MNKISTVKKCMLKKKDPSSRPAERVYRTGHRESIQRYFHNNDFFYSSGDSIIANKVVYRFSAVTVKCEARLRVTIFPSHPLMPPPPHCGSTYFFLPSGLLLAPSYSSHSRMTWPFHRSYVRFFVVVSTPGALKRAMARVLICFYEDSFFSWGSSFYILC